jgi:shikimate dehydrogenase
MSASDLAALFQLAKPGDVGIIGHPVKHSLSPAMHNAAFQTWSGTFDDREISTPTYHKFDVPPDLLKESFALAKKAGLRGFNVTVPHKVDSLALLTDLDKSAKRAGAVNTVVKSGAGWRGLNTDGDGFRRSLSRDGNFDGEGKTALVFGAGGTGRVIVHQLLDLELKRIYWFNRDPRRLKDAMHWFPADRVTPLSGAADAARHAAETDMVINATSVGLNDGDGLPASGLAFRPGQVAFDVVYHRDTEFLKKAREQGARAVDGLGMLLFQGAKAFEIWMSVPAPLDVMRAALLKSLKEG